MRSLILIAALAFAGLAHTQTLPPGPQVLSFYSDLDDSEQPYAIYIPKNYTPTRQYPLVVMLHGAGSNHRLALRRVFGKSNIAGETDVEASKYFPPWKDIDVIVAAPYARGTAGYEGLVEKDVMDMLADVKRRFSIDENKTYLTGLSMGGGGTLWIGLRHPDLWAAIAPVCPAPPENCELLAPNAINMAVQFVHGDADPVVPVDISRNWTKNLRSLETPVVELLELPGVQHDSWVGAYKDERIFDWFLKFTRNPYPDTVRLVSFDIAHGKSYWVRFDAKTPGKEARIFAAFNGKNTINITTGDLLAFTLLLDDHPKFSANTMLEVTVDGQEMRIPSGRNEFAFSKGKNRDGEFVWSAKPRIQRSGKQFGDAEGPVRNAFASRHIYVYGTLDNPTPDVLKARIDTALKASEWSAYRGEFLGRVKFFPRVLADKELRRSDYETSNLIVFGTAETNAVIAAMKSQLPMQLQAEATPEYGLVYVYPNDYGRLVVINSGLPWWLARDTSKWRFLPEAQTPINSFGDYILFKRDRTIIAEGYFEVDWKMPAEVMLKLDNMNLVR